MYLFCLEQKNTSLISISCKQEIIGQVIYHSIKLFYEILMENFGLSLVIKNSERKDTYVLWGQPIKLIQVQNFMNIDGTTLILIFLSPPLVAGPQK